MSGQNFPQILNVTLPQSLEEIITTRMLDYITRTVPVTTKATKLDFLYIPFMSELFLDAPTCSTPLLTSQLSLIKSDIVHLLLNLLKIPGSTKFILPLSLPLADFDRSFLNASMVENMRERFVMVGVDGRMRGFVERGKEWKFLIDVPSPTRFVLKDLDELDSLEPEKGEDDQISKEEEREEDQGVSRRRGRAMKGMSSKHVGLRPSHYQTIDPQRPFLVYFGISPILTRGRPFYLPFSLLGIIHSHFSRTSPPPPPHFPSFPPP